MCRFLLASLLAIFAAFGSQASAYQGLRNATSEGSSILKISYAFSAVTVSREQKVVAGVDRSGQVYLTSNLDVNNENWKDVSGGRNFKTISVTGDSKLLWGIENSGQAWSLDYNSWEGWQRISTPKNMQQIVATDDQNVVMGLEDTKYPQVYVRSNGNWQRLGTLYNSVDSIAISGDGRKKYVVNSSGNLLQFIGGQWSADLGNENMQYLSITSAKMVGVSKNNGRIWYCNYIPCGSRWYEDRSSTKFKEVAISGDSKYLWATTPYNDVYRKGSPSGTLDPNAGWREL